MDNWNVDETETIRSTRQGFDGNPLSTIDAPDRFGLGGLRSITKLRRSTEESSLTHTQGGAMPLSRLRSALG